VAHAAGCPVSQVLNFSQFVHNYPWMVGIIMILGGPIVGLYGRRFFPWVIAGIVSVNVLLGTLVFCSVVGFMESTVSLSISIGFAFIVSGLAGWFVMKTVWIAVGILGIIGGFFMGSMIFTIFLAALGFGQLWAMILFSVLCAVGSGFLSFRFSKQVVLFFTSLLGSYAFMRGFTYFFGGFPGEAEIYQSLRLQQPIVNLTNAFWIYLAMFISGFIGGIYY
jgi:hypothetical protein